MIGEIRDEETAKIAVRASITGHLVLSTLHTNDSLTAITRLIDMKIPDYLVIESISCIISQRLVRKLCDYCKKEEVIDKKDQESYFLKTNKLKINFFIIYHDPDSFVIFYLNHDFLKFV